MRVATRAIRRYPGTFTVRVCRHVLLATLAVVLPGGPRPALRASMALGIRCPGAADREVVSVYRRRSHCRMASMYSSVGIKSRSRFPKPFASVLIKIGSELIERVPNLRATRYSLLVCCFDKPVSHGADYRLRVVLVMFDVNAGQIRECTPVVKLTRFKNQAALSLQVRSAKELRASINPQFEGKVEAREQILRGCRDA